MRTESGTMMSRVDRIQLGIHFKVVLRITDGHDEDQTMTSSNDSNDHVYGSLVMLRLV